MLAVAKLFVALALALGVSAAAHGHHARAGHHGAVVRRGTNNQLSPLLARQAATTLKVNRAACRPKTSTLTTASSTSTSTSTTSTPPPPTTTSTWVAPTTSSTPPPAPTTTWTPPAPTTTWKPDPTPTPTPTPTPATPAGNTRSGDATYYTCGLGACGQTDGYYSNTVAVSHELFDTFPNYDGTNPNNNPICGKQLMINWKGQQIPVTVTDRCAGCEGKYNLDFCEGFFQQHFASDINGRGTISWTGV